jgi:hypothetical protein
MEEQYLSADTNVHDMPNGSELADITEQSAQVVREIFDIEPKQRCYLIQILVNHLQKDLLIFVMH